MNIVLELEERIIFFSIFFPYFYSTYYAFTILSKKYNIEF